MDDQGNIVETLDFCPRFKRKGRIYRPVAFVRVVRPVAGSPRIRVRLRPITAWGQGQPDVRYGSNHIRLPLSSWPCGFPPMRLLACSPRKATSETGKASG